MTDEEHKKWCADLDKIHNQNSRIEELESIIKNALTSLAIMQMPVQEDNLVDIATNKELTEIMANSFRQALGYKLH